MLSKAHPIESTYGKLWKRKGVEYFPPSSHRIFPLHLKRGPFFVPAARAERKSKGNFVNTRGDDVTVPQKRSRGPITQQRVRNPRTRASPTSFMKGRFQIPVLLSCSPLIWHPTMTVKMKQYNRNFCSSSVRNLRIPQYISQPYLDL